MTSMDHETVVLELDTLIRDTQTLIDKVEQCGLDQTQADDYDQLLIILDSAVKQQRAHTLAMLNASSHA
ncbi:hypothetical protein [Vreelandella aquamarina]|uniref:Uncharacterized protein n=1 Tax=Vreelandella aquamarina TaxID=77097 RepID=A0A857GPB6_9GAMM|nr:hypothetical protein [Halomonas meridiana]QHD51025.1 hypothetical protein CTT34_15730 [Halomonas meridiana]